MNTVIGFDQTLAKAVLDAIRVKFEMDDIGRRDNVHVSELLHPHQAWLARKYPKQLSDEECLMFIAGQGHHAIVETLLAKKKMREVAVEWNGIVGTVDCIVEGKSHPYVEFKSTRAPKKYSPETLPQNYVNQLGMYVAMLNENEDKGEGTVLVLHLSTRRRMADGRMRYVPRLLAFPITYDNLVDIRRDMLTRKAWVLSSNVPPIHTCEAWLCRSCRFYMDECEGLEV